MSLSGCVCLVEGVEDSRGASWYSRGFVPIVVVCFLAPEVGSTVPIVRENPLGDL